jgi:anaerobic magnesium-protoporphyrin IX monomethyl ester cyclase
MRVALVVAPNWSTKTPPLGSAILAATVNRAGHSARIFDLNARCWSRGDKHQKRFWIDRKFWSEKNFFGTLMAPWLEPEIQRMTEELVQWNPEIVGFSVFSSSLLCTLLVARKLRQALPETKIVFGGPAITQTELENEAAELRPLVDLAVIGEGEETLEELLSRWSQGLPVEGCAGIAYFDKNGDWKFEPPRSAMKMERIPAPEFVGIEWENYPRVLPIMMSRGCVAKCTFCSETRFWKIYRYREPESVFQEMKSGWERHGIRDFEFNDSLINGNFKQLGQLVDLLNEAKMGLRWHGLARLDRRMTPDFLKKMADAGCQFLRYGFESGSQKVTDLMEKRTTVELARQVVRDTANAGIQAILQVIVGFPGESEEDFQATLDFVEENARFIGAVCPNPMMITADVPIGMNPAKYGVRNDIEHIGGAWESVDGTNTLNVRRERMDRMIGLLERQNIHLGLS